MDRERRRVLRHAFDAVGEVVLKDSDVLNARVKDLNNIFGYFPALAVPPPAGTVFLLKIRTPNNYF
jgi:hypothetical protein